MTEDPKFVEHIDDIVAQCLSDSDAWFPNQSRDLPFLALCLAGEVGETCNEIKKIVRGTHTDVEQLEKVKEEVTDTFIYLMNIVGVLGFDLPLAYNKKRAINQERFGK
jgi:NTP pyrophosphatase (non-canonical NTP hydrolase)